jgi:hypothetical protein
MGIRPRLCSRQREWPVAAGLPQRAPSACKANQRIRSSHSIPRVSQGPPAPGGGMPGMHGGGMPPMQGGGMGYPGMYGGGMPSGPGMYGGEMGMPGMHGGGMGMPGRVFF